MDDIAVHPFTRALFAWFSQYPWVGTLFAVMVLDVLSGFIAAFRTKQLDSSVSWVGMAKKAGVWLIILLAAALNKATPEIPAAKLVAFFYILHESLSIVENLGRAGVPLPPLLMDSLARMRTAMDARQTPEPGQSAPMVIERERVETRTIFERPAAAGDGSGGGGIPSSSPVVRVEVTNQNAPTVPVPLPVTVTNPPAPAVAAETAVTELPPGGVP